MATRKTEQEKKAEELLKQAELNEAEKKESEKKLDEAMSKSTKSYKERIANQEGGSWFRYTKQMAQKWGKHFSIYGPTLTEYTFQIGMKTFVLDEDEQALVDTFDEVHKASGEPVNSDPFKDLR